MAVTRKHGRFFLDDSGELRYELVQYDGVDLSGDPVFDRFVDNWGEDLAYCLVTTAILAEKAGLMVQVLDGEGTAWDTSYPVFPEFFLEALAALDRLSDSPADKGIREYSIVIGFSSSISLETQDEIERTAVLCASKSIGFRYIFTLFYVRYEDGLIGIRRVGGREVEELILEGRQRA